MSYTPPSGGSVGLAFASSFSYSPPPGGSLTLEFVPPAGGTILTTSIGDTSAFGSIVLKWTQFASPSGIDSLGIGAASVDYHRLRPAGADYSAFGTANVYLGQQFVTGASIGDTSVMSTPSRVYHIGDYFSPVGTSVVLDFNPSNRYPNGYTLPNGGSIDLAWDYADNTARQNGDGNMQAHVYATMGDTSAFGLPTMQIVQSAHPTGFDTHAFGTADVELFTRTLTLTGFDAHAVGSAKLQSVIKPTGLSTLAFGTSAIAQPAPHTLTLAGFDAHAFGVADVELRNRTVYPLGVDFGISPRQRVSYGIQTVVTNSVSPLAFGTASIANRNRTISPAGFDASRFGADVVHLQGATPAGFDTHAFGAPVVDFGTRTLFFGGLAPPPMGVNKVQLKDSFAFTAGQDWGDVGDNSIVCRDGDQIVRDIGGDDYLGLGAATVVGLPKNNWIYPYPIAGGLMGNPSIIPINLYLNGRGIAPPVLGNAWVSLWIRTLMLTGINSLRFGNTYVSHSPIVAQMQGFDHAVVWDFCGPIGPAGEPAANVGHATSSTISPAGIAPGSVGGQMVQAVITESGFDQSAMGYSRVVGMTGGFPGRPIWGGLTVTDGGGGFYSYTTPAISMGDYSAFGTANVHF